MSGLSEAYAACEAVLADSGSSFALPIRLLPPAKRLATTALYAFCRVADDITDAAIGDGAATVPADPSAEIGKLRESLVASLDGETSPPSGIHGDRTRQVLRAVADAARRYGIPRPLLFEIIEGVEMDLSPREFGRFAELEEYCRKVASAVGIAAIHIWGFRSERALAPGHACGVAFQLTNILRDVREDALAGRVYLPTEDFVACGVDRTGWLAAASAEGSLPHGTEGVVGRVRSRAVGFYEAARDLDPLLSTDGRLVFRAMYGSYAAIFRDLGVGVGSLPTRKTPLRKLRLAAAAAACVLLGPARVPVAGGRRA